MNYRIGKRVSIAMIACLLLAMLSLGVQIGSGEALSQSSQIIRVLLTRLQLTDRLDLQVDGSYTVGDIGISFQRGSKITLSCASGSLMLYYEGMALNAGKSLTFRRHAITTDEENGIRFDGDYALYTGDLVVSMQNGMLRAVLHVPLEEYLLGVVPYEMSDSFPLEALKAQAVTARTYALRKTGGSQDYDVVDNTNDQVYKGMNKQNVRAGQAVLETAGVCGYYKNSLAECFYSASNGGQTELVHNVWGTGDYSYLQMTDDPYDIENPESAVMRAKIAKTVSGYVGGNETLHALLMDQIPEMLAARGFDDECENIKIAHVASVTAHTPVFETPSKVFAQLRFDLLVDGKRILSDTDLEEDVSFPGAEPFATETPAILGVQTPALSDFQRVPGVVSVDVGYFQFAEQLLGLSINDANNELLTIVENDDHFELQARRYGHGVGMSQRGAQWMASKYDWTYEQILRFYYPGMTLKVTMGKQTLPPPVEAQYLATPGPAATPTPRPTLMPATATLEEGQWRAAVTLIEQNSYLNLRDEPSMQGGVLMRLYYGQELVVLGIEADGWLLVKTDAAEGYVMEKFVQKQE